MADVFLEQRVVRPPTPRDIVWRAGAVAGGMILVLVLALVFPHPFVVLLLATAVLYAVHTFVKRQRREYEYAFTNGSLDIDVIYNREWRQRVISVEFPSAVVLMVGTHDPRHAEAVARHPRVRDLGSGTGEAGTYLLVVRRGDGQTALLWNPAPDLVKACRNAAPQVVFPCLPSTDAPTP